MLSRGRRQSPGNAGTALFSVAPLQDERLRNADNFASVQLFRLIYRYIQVSVLLWLQNDILVTVYFTVGMVREIQLLL
jgi:hypothetical protein